MRKWIKSSEEMPANDDLVIVFDKRDGVHVGYFERENVKGYTEEDGNFFETNSGWTTYYEWAPHSKPTHWMPLPEEPNEG